MVSHVWSVPGVSVAPHCIRCGVPRSLRTLRSTSICPMGGRVAAPPAAPEPLSAALQHTWTDKGICTACGTTTADALAGSLWACTPIKRGDPPAAPAPPDIDPHERPVTKRIWDEWSRRY